MKKTFAHSFLAGFLLIALTAAISLAQEKAASPPSPEAKAVIEELQALRVPETIAYLKTVDPKVLAEALKTPEGEWALTLASRWSTPRPDTHDYPGKIALAEYRYQLAREFAQLPDAAIHSLLVWRATADADEFLKLSRAEKDQILDTEEAMRVASFLAKLTPEQRDAAYELQDLEIEEAKRALRQVPESKAERIALTKKELYELFTRWGPEKFRHVLEGEWSAVEFLKAFATLAIFEHVDLFTQTQWNLSKMPSWFWEEVAEFTKRPDAYRPFLNLGNDHPSGDGFQARTALSKLAEALKDKEMEEAVLALDRRFNPIPGEASMQ